MTASAKGKGKEGQQHQSKQATGNPWQPAIPLVCPLSQAFQRTMAARKKTHGK